MSSIWTRSTVVAAAAALVSLAIVPALAQTEETPPSEVPEMPSGSDRYSRPSDNAENVDALRLRAAQAAAANICISAEEKEADAVKACSTQLNCTPPKTTKCQKRQNFNDWRCTCK